MHTVNYPTAKALTDALGGQWNKMRARGRAKCPAHSDENPSLDIEEKGGRTLVICRTNCGQDEVLDALRAKGLWPEHTSGAASGKGGGSKVVVATYSYQLENGREHFQVVRFAPKDFRPRYSTGSGWVWKLPVMQRHLPYRLPELLEAIANEKPIFIVEGEKDVENARDKLNIVATCNAGGAGKWGAEHAAYFKGANVVIVPDNDSAGHRHAEASVGDSLIGIAKRVRIVTLPGLLPKGDLSDWISAGGTAEQLWALVDQAPDWGRANGRTTGADDAWSDPIPLPTNLLPVAPFDYRMLPEKMRPWVEDVSERMQCPADFVAIPLMVALGSLIGRKVTVRPKMEDDWYVVSNLWGLCIGTPGVMKSPAQNQGLHPLRILGEKAREAWKSAKAEYASKAKARKKADNSNLLEADEPEEPTLKRYITTNPTVAALGKLLQQNPNGILVDRDEMLSLLDGLDEEGRSDERAFYLSGWAGDTPYTFDRIVRGLDLHIPPVCISMIGGTQPARISRYLAQVRRGISGNDGLIQRFGLMVWPDIPAAWTNVDRKPDPEARHGAFRVFEALDRLDWRVIGAKCDCGVGCDEDGPPYLRLSQAAHERFVAWRTGLEHRLRPADLDPLDPMLGGHLPKYRKVVPAIALITHLADGGTNEVDEQAVEKALRWAAYLETHAARTYASSTLAAADAARAILAKIKSGHLKEKFGHREVWRPQWSRLRDLDTVKAALQLLSDHDWLIAATKETGGRRTTEYTVNPKALAWLSANTP